MLPLFRAGVFRHAYTSPPQEAAWAISNATSGGKPEQIKYLVTEGCIPPLSDLLEVHDAKIITVALEGLENILKVSKGTDLPHRCVCYLYIMDARYPSRT